MSDPIPSATADHDAADHKSVSNAEDRKAAAALSSLNVSEIATEGASDGAPETANQEALGKAMSRLDIATGEGPMTKKAGVQKSPGGGAKQKVVKLAAADIALLVDQLDLTKIKAMELLKLHDGDTLKAMKAFIAPTFKA
ncbi:hypothetical protein N7541_009946 [Penicillium brevicompactum]|uniref:Nascent polypeptide-associated complex subunit alpha-like UBA domain-containing protein n=1 Tax=Penicillium brevicompactum TaxID=5074 RepID=A0A9W9UH58_PENBR|nr:hypothetical protein N7541_009946 [Penicillium brevicompactum]